ncbi:MAG: ABC transporter ATP-binding protein [Halobacteriales archaeon]
MSEDAVGPAVDDPILELEDVHAAYGETAVLRGVSLAVAPGEVVALIGRNGAGKTTTLNSVLGKVRITAGSVRLKGADVTEWPANETVSRGVALVPEDRRIFPDLTVRENLRVGGLGGADDGFARDVDAVFEMFENLRVNADSPGSNLSGGEQQMLAIGRALVAGADVLMLDEPTEGLAPLIVERVEELIDELNDEGLTILLVEQNAEVALNVADRIYVMDRGRIVYHGTAAELRADDEVKNRYLGVKV